MVGVPYSKGCSLCRERHIKVSRRISRPFNDALYNHMDSLPMNGCGRTSVTSAVRSAHNVEDTDPPVQDITAT